MDVKKIAAATAISMLKASGVKFAVIDHDGVKHGGLDVVLPRNGRKFPRGAFIGHFLPFIKDMKANDACLIPFGPFGEDDQTKDQLRSALSSHCSRTWGKKAHITFSKADGIELLRLE